MVPKIFVSLHQLQKSFTGLLFIVLDLVRPPGQRRNKVLFCWLLENLELLKCVDKTNWKKVKTHKVKSQCKTRQIISLVLFSFGLGKKDRLGKKVSYNP